MIQTIESKLNKFKEQLISAKALKEDKQNQLESRVQAYDQLQDQITLLKHSQELLEQSNIASREFVRVEVEKLVTQGLQFILNDPHIKFNIEFVSKRNQIEANFSLTKLQKGQRLEGDILFTNGGGLADIISTCLRIVMMQLLNVKGPLVLDEPGKYISTQYVANFGKFLTKISETFNRQIILITHNETLAQFASTKIKVEQSFGVSTIKNVTI